MIRNIAIFYCPSKIDHKEFKKDSPETPGSILKDQGSKNWKKFQKSRGGIHLGVFLRVA